MCICVCMRVCGGGQKETGGLGDFSYKEMRWATG